MQMISAVSNTSKVPLFKKLVAVRATPNYHFMPDHQIDEYFKGDIISTMKDILASNWGTWGPKHGELLVQTRTIVAGDITCEVALSRDDASFKNIYVFERDRSGPTVKSTMYLGTTGYYCCATKEGTDLYELVDPIFNEGEIGSQWTNIRSGSQEN